MARGDLRLAAGLLPAKRGRWTELEALLYLSLLDHGLPPPEPEVLWHPTRAWRADFGYPDHALLLEAEGGVMPYRDPHTGELRTRGRHITIGGFQDDCLKYDEAALYGWRVLRFTRAMIEGDAAAALTARALAWSGPPPVRAPRAARARKAAAR